MTLSTLNLASGNLKEPFMPAGFLSSNSNHPILQPRKTPLDLRPNRRRQNCAAHLLMHLSQRYGSKLLPIGSVTALSVVGTVQDAARQACIPDKSTHGKDGHMPILRDNIDREIALR